MSRPYTRIDYRRREGMSKVEKRHLGIALGVLTLAFAIAFSGGIYGADFFTLGFLITLGISLLSVGTAFVFHELAHRKIARKFGCWAEFRMWRWGLMLALLFSLFGFVFAAPGAVMIRGYITREQNGKISAAGPATNWAVGAVFLIASILTAFSGITVFGLPWILSAVSFVNLFIGGFNLLPLGPLDGRKIFAWSFKNYLILAGLIVGTLAAGYYLGPFQFFL